MSGYLKEINKKEALKYLGYRGGEVEDKILRDIDQCSEIIIKNALPKVIYRVFDIESDLSFSGTNFSPKGNDIAEMLKDCGRAIIMAATIGGEIDGIIRRREVDDMYLALMLDSCASCAIENVCDNFQNELEERLFNENLYLTDRFSPGYGDMPFEQQREICEILNTSKTIGVSLNESGIMIPRKSVTAIMGIAQKPQKKRFRGCEYCSMFENCDFRKGGITCGKC